MLKLYRSIKNMSNYTQVLIVQSILYLLTISSIYRNFDLGLLLSGLAIGWVLFCIGVSVTLHKWISHRSFVPRNRFIKIVLLWAGVQSTLGSPIGFAAGHRQHHANSDTDRDPFILTNSVWHNIKLWFYHFDTKFINPRLVRDLAQDRDIKFFHTHYWKIWAVYPMILFVIDQTLFVYLFALPAVYVFLGMSYVTVIAHSTLWRGVFCRSPNKDTTDKSWDSWLFSLLFAGEGYHKTHHANPGMNNYRLKTGKIDFSGEIIKLLRK